MDAERLEKLRQSLRDLDLPTWIVDREIQATIAREARLVTDREKQVVQLQRKDIFGD